MSSNNIPCCHVEGQTPCRTPRMHVSVASCVSLHRNDTESHNAQRLRRSQSMSTSCESSLYKRGKGTPIEHRCGQRRFRNAYRKSLSVDRYDFSSRMTDTAWNSTIFLRRNPRSSAFSLASHNEALCDAALCPWRGDSTPRYMLFESSPMI